MSCIEHSQHSNPIVRRAEGRPRFRFLYERIDVLTTTLMIDWDYGRLPYHSLQIHWQCGQGLEDRHMESWDPCRPEGDWLICGYQSHRSIEYRIESLVRVFMSEEEKIDSLFIEEFLESVWVNTGYACAHLQFTVVFIVNHSERDSEREVEPLTIDSYFVQSSPSKSEQYIGRWPIAITHGTASRLAFAAWFDEYLSFINGY